MCFLGSQDFFWQVFKNKKWLLSGNTDQLSRIRPENLQSNKEKNHRWLICLSERPPQMYTLRSLQVQSYRKGVIVHLAVYFSIHLGRWLHRAAVLRPAMGANGRPACCHSGGALCSLFSKTVTPTPYFSLSNTYIWKNNTSQYPPGSWPHFLKDRLRTQWGKMLFNDNVPTVKAV